MWLKYSLTDKALRLCNIKDCYNNMIWKGTSPYSHVFQQEAYILLYLNAMTAQNEH